MVGILLIASSNPDLQAKLDVFEEKIRQKLPQAKIGERFLAIKKQLMRADGPDLGYIRPILDEIREIMAMHSPVCIKIFPKPESCVSNERIYRELSQMLDEIYGLLNNNRD